MPDEIKSGDETGSSPKLPMKPIASMPMPLPRGGGSGDSSSGSPMAKMKHIASMPGVVKTATTRSSNFSTMMGEDDQFGTNVRRSIRRQEWTNMIDGNDNSLLEGSAHRSGSPSKQQQSRYQDIINKARACVGHGAAEGAFPEEWDAQLLIDCGRTSSDRRLVLFCPAFLKPILGDTDELDLAFRFNILAMDEIAMYEKYDFVYCYLGMDLSDPALAHRLRVAYDILPRKYAKHLHHFYILHPTVGFKMTMWTFYPWLTTRFWSKIKYVDSIDELLRLLEPDAPEKWADTRRRFPQMVHRRDAECLGKSPPVTFGVPLTHLCNNFGIDYTDKTTGRWYPRLPPGLIFLCELMERIAADENFGDVFTPSGDVTYQVVDILDKGLPLESDIPTAALWCGLKLFVDCLPSPLFSYAALDELHKKGIRHDDTQAHREFLIDLFANKLPCAAANTALYIASFLHTMCQNACDRQAVATVGLEEGLDFDWVLSPTLAAKVFAPGFFRPKVMTAEALQTIPVAHGVMETLIRSAEEPELWVGKHVVVPRWGKAGEDTDESSSEESVSE
mmetsp:Transcript_128524/g.363745  ORF Transcript_128524/g.363745 Transcript_128524/m.363745 type:complete len:561 (+) Transcript_128524:127-1809(+)